MKDNKQASRTKIGKQVSKLIKESKIPIEQIERDTKLSKTIIYNIIKGKGYTIDSLLTVLHYLDRDIEIK